MTRILSVTLLSAVLTASPALAQTTATSPPTPAPVVAPAPPAPFPADAPVGFVDLQAVFDQSAFGRGARDQVTALRQKLDVQLQARNQEMTTLSQQIQTQQSIVTEAVLAGWTSALQRLQRQAQFEQQEAQIQIDELQTTLLADFERHVLPVIEAIRSERRLLAIFSLPAPAEPTGLRVLAVDRSLNLSSEVVRRLDGQS